MKVIFIKDLKKQGKVNDVKEVSDGYAVNYLIKNGYAVKYTKTSSAILDREIEDKKIKDAIDIENANKLKDKLEKMETQNQTEKKRRQSRLPCPRSPSSPHGQNS